MIRSHFSLIRVAILALFIITACESRTPPENLKLVALYPKKEDIYLRSGQAFSLAEFYSLQETYPTLAPAELLRLSVFSQLAARELSSSKHPPSLVELTQILRVLLPPATPSGEDPSIDQRIRTLFNVGSRKELRDHLEKSLSSEPTQWNEPLLREIRVEKKPWG